MFFFLFYLSYFSQILDLSYRAVCNSNHKQNNTDTKFNSLGTKPENTELKLFILVKYISYSS